MRIQISLESFQKSIELDSWQENTTLRQIVYTATSFSTVNSVQFIIEGQREDYLGSEGTWIGSPLSRSSFQ